MRILNEYDLNPPNVNPSFVNPNSTKASFWWAQSILETYWNWSADVMSRQSECPEGTCRGEIRKAYVRYRPNKNLTITDIMDPKYFRLQWWMVVGRNDSSLGIYYHGKRESYYAYNYTEQKRWPDSWWNPTEKLAKSMWSTILVDLGVNTTSNILLDPKKLQDFTADMVDSNDHKTSARRGPETKPYDPTSTRYGPLGTTPAVINAVYICNVPRRKSVGTLAWSIILADLVFLQALWIIFKLSVDAYLERKVSGSMSCQGCQELLGQRGDDQEKELFALRRARPFTAQERSGVTGEAILGKGKNHYNLRKPRGSKGCYEGKV